MFINLKTRLNVFFPDQLKKVTMHYKRVEYSMDIM